MLHHGSALRKLSRSEVELKLLNTGFDGTESETIPVDRNFALILATTSSAPLSVPDTTIIRTFFVMPLTKVSRKSFSLARHPTMSNLVS